MTEFPRTMVTLYCRRTAEVDNGTSPQRIALRIDDIKCVARFYDHCLVITDDGTHYEVADDFDVIVLHINARAR